MNLLFNGRVVVLSRNRHLVKKVVKSIIYAERNLRFLTLTPQQRIEASFKI